jgi:predicted MPP superfamily phosphohydrolase
MQVWISVSFLISAFGFATSTVITQESTDNVVPTVAITVQDNDTATESTIQFSTGEEIIEDDGFGFDDSTCVWKASKLCCEPVDICGYNYRFGDTTLSQSCRLKQSAWKLPQQIHLAFAGTPTGTGMTISWTTFEKIEGSIVWVGTQPTDLRVPTNVALKIDSYYQEDDYQLHSYHATVTGLTPHTKYYYKVGSATDVQGQSPVNSFITARSSNDKEEFEIAVFGDLGGDSNAMETINYLNKLPGKIDFVYHVGDISYADNAFLHLSQLVGFFYEEAWNKWMNDLSPAMEQLPYMVLVGNHEAECHDPACQISKYRLEKLSNYSAYNTRFKMPSEEVGGTKNMWYSFESGPIHFTSVSSETDFPNAPSNDYTWAGNNGNFGNQLRWLEEDLKKAHANREQVPWIIVGMHRPVYTLIATDKDGNPTKTSKTIQQAFEELFLKYQVDLVFAGHHHHYERQMPVARGKPVLDGVSTDFQIYQNPKAPVYIVNGAAGNSEGHQVPSCKKSPWNVMFDSSEFGISTVKVSRTKLQWKFIGSGSEKIIDQFIMTKAF